METGKGFLTLCKTPPPWLLLESLPTAMVPALDYGLFWGSLGSGWLVTSERPWPGLGLIQNGEVERKEGTHQEGSHSAGKGSEAGEWPYALLFWAKSEGSVSLKCYLPLSGNLISTQ